MIEALLKAVGEEPRQGVYLVHGDLVLAEPAAQRLAQALAEAAGCEVEVRRRPPSLAPLLDDLRTYSLFAAAKVVLAVDTAVLADRSAAAELIDDAEAALPVGEEAGELPSRARQGASRLFQALRLFDIDPQAGDAAAVIASLPDWALQGGKAVRRRKPRGRTKKDVQALAEGLAALLEAARQAGIEGWAEGDAAGLAEAVRGGLPEGHALVLVERSVADDHPVVTALKERRAVAHVSEVVSERRGGWQGLDDLARELERQTGVGIARDALAELARRTLRQERQGGAEAATTARLAGEYRKLAHLARGQERITLAMVDEAVEDRGQEDVWQLLDAVGAGKADEALSRLHRLLAAAEDPVGARLSFFGLLASFCRQLTAIRGVMRVARVAAGERNYNRFKSRMAPALQGELPGGGKNPLAGLHPYRLHRAYLAACRIPEAEVATLPWTVLVTELRLKGESSDPDAALADLVTRLATAGR